MYLTVHAAIGVTLAAAVTNDPATAFAVGWLMHYVGDLVPHGDEAVGEWARRGNEVKRLALLAGLDAAILTFVIAWITARHGFHWSLLAAAAGSLAPDVLWGLEKTFNRKLFGPLGRWHGQIHNFFGVRLPFWLGLAGQLALAAALWLTVGR